jgi:hypothetical protein
MAFTVKIAQGLHQKKSSFFFPSPLTAFNPRFRSAPRLLETQKSGGAL